MTGMPWSVALLTDVLIASPSWARMIRTLAPCEISWSTLVAWVAALDFASFERYSAPAAVRAALMAGSSHLAHRSSVWFSHDTPTLQPFAEPVPPLAAAPLAPALPAAPGAVLAPLLEQAASAIAAVATSAATLRFIDT